MTDGRGRACGCGCEPEEDGWGTGRPPMPSYWGGVGSTYSAERPAGWISSVAYTVSQNAVQQKGNSHRRSPSLVPTLLTGNGGSLLLGPAWSNQRWLIVFAKKKGKKRDSSLMQLHTGKVAGVQLHAGFCNLYNSKTFNNIRHPCGKLATRNDMLVLVQTGIVGLCVSWSSLCSCKQVADEKPFVSLEDRLARKPHCSPAGLPSADSAEARRGERERTHQLSNGVTASLAAHSAQMKVVGALFNCSQSRARTSRKLTFQRMRQDPSSLMQDLSPSSCDGLLIIMWSKFQNLWERRGQFVIQ